MTIFDHPDFDGHEFVHVLSDRNSGLKAIIGIHDSTLGPALGGLRMFDYASDLDALQDVLRLSRGMTFKNALAGIPYGGGKAVIIGNPKTDKTDPMLLALGRAIDRLNGGYITAEDVGTTVSDMDTLRTETSFARGTSTGVGDPSPFTAKGVFLAIREAVAFKFDGRSMDGVSVAVQGLGNVGLNLCRLLADAGAKLIVTDIDGARVSEVTRELGAVGTAPEKIISANVDVFAPCAMGAAINDETLAYIQASIVCGAANNQLATPTHGSGLAEQGILYVPDFLANAGGVINIGLEGTASTEEIWSRVGGIADTTRQVLQRTRNGGLPEEIAEALAKEKIANAGGSDLAA